MTSLLSRWFPAYLGAARRTSPWKRESLEPIALESHFQDSSEMIYTTEIPLAVRACVLAAKASTVRGRSYCDREGSWDRTACLVETGHQSNLNLQEWEI